MKKIGLAVVVLIFGVCLYAGSVSDFDNSYIASVKFQRCIEISQYPGKNVKPSKLVNDGCSIYKIDREHGALTLKCPGISYWYTKSYADCNRMLARLLELNNK